MKQLISMTASQSVFDQYGGARALPGIAGRLGCSGYELIWAGEPIPELPPGLTYGYHITFYPDWLDYWREDAPALERKFGNRAAWTDFYGGDGRERLMKLYREDFDRAAACGAPYVVFHVSDVSIEEGYTYRWLHTDEEVIEASVDILNTVLSEKDYPFTVLLENQWWPGLTFTRPGLTAGLLEGIKHPRKGIMLDTGHLMNCNTALRTQKDGIEYLHKILDLNGGLCGCIKGIHLHYSLSGRYVRAHTGTIPADFPPPEDCMTRFARSYGHILKIDTHRPWTDPDIVSVIERVAPDYLVHELVAKTPAGRLKAVSIQLETLRAGGLSRRDKISHPGDII